MAVFSVIECEMNNNVFVEKHECEDFNTLSQLIVRESQEAVFFKDGLILDVLGPGRYTLKTQNIPLLGKLINLPMGGETPFKCAIYFINKTEQMAINWGTDSKVEYMLPDKQFPIQIGACGTMSLRVADSKELLTKLVGTEKQLNQETLNKYFKGILMMYVKEYIANYMENSKANIFEIDRYLSQMADALKERLYDHFLSYGVTLERFNVEKIVKPENDPNYIRYKNSFVEKHLGMEEERIIQEKELIRQETKSKKTILESQANANKRHIEGFTYQEQRAYDIAQNAAQNPGVGNFASFGTGMGMMGGMATGIGATIAGLTTQAISSIQKPSNMSDTVTEPVDSMPPMLEIKDDNPQMNSESNIQHNHDDFKVRVDKLKYAYEAGFMTEEEFNIKRNELLQEI